MDPQLYKAAKHGDITLLKQVVNGEDASRRLQSLTPRNNNTLHVSVSFGHIDFVKEVYDMLLQHNSNLEGNTDYSRSLLLLTQVNSAGDTALHVAAREGHVSIAEFLIEKILPWPSYNHDLESGESSSLTGAQEHAREKIRMRNKSNNTAMHEAIRRNDHQMVGSLIKADCDIWRTIFDAADAESAESLLYMAAKGGSLNIVKEILENFPSAAHGGPHGRTALHVAVVKGHSDVVKELLKKKGREPINELDEKDRSALHYAAAFDREPMIMENLLEYDTSCAYQLDKYDLSPLHIAALKSNTLVFDLLIKYCPDSVELMGKNNRNILHFAVMNESPIIIMTALQLIELEELINQPDDDGNTPFHLAAKRGLMNFMKPFVTDKRVDQKATNKNGQTAAEIFPIKYQLDLLGAENVRGEDKWIIRADEDHRERNKEPEAAVRSDEQIIEKNLQIVASLLATVTFAAVFQVPGGYNSSDGKPVLLNNESFQKFLSFDAIAMCTSTASLMIMLASPGRGFLHSRFLNFAKFLIYVALASTSAAFLEGFKAVLPHCRRFLCFSDHSTQTFSIIAIFVIIFLCYIPFGYGLIHLGSSSTHQAGVKILKRFMLSEKIINYGNFHGRNL